VRNYNREISPRFGGATGPVEGYPTETLSARSVNRDAPERGTSPMTLTPAQRKLRAQIAANTRWSKEDPTPTGPRGQAGLLARFEREVDPNNELPPAERARRAEADRKAHMQRLALASARARRSQGGSAAGGSPGMTNPRTGEAGARESSVCARPAQDNPTPLSTSVPSNARAASLWRQARAKSKQDSEAHAEPGC
jgi:hypothetical protein